MYPAGGDFAHDTLEHFSPPTDDDHILNEALALGTVWWGRVGANWLNRSASYYTAEQGLVQLATSFAEEVHMSGEDLLPAKHRVLPDASSEGFAQDYLAPELAKCSLPDSAAVVLSWMRVGWVRADKRWGERSPGWTREGRRHKFVSLFWDINSQTRNPHKCSEEEGNRVKYVVDPQMLTCEVYTQDWEGEEWQLYATYN